jgi:hypothetical protein
MRFIAPSLPIADEPETKAVPSTLVNEDDERDSGGMGLGRTLALSDGVFAIAMTLLAFQIQLPPSRDRSPKPSTGWMIATSSTS